MTLPALRTWQVAALARWNESGCRGIFEIATGGGKTMFALAAREGFIASHPGTKTVVVVPTNALLDQWYVEIVDGLGVPETDVRILRGKDLRPSSPVNLVVVNTARRFADLTVPIEPVLLIVDECHRAGSPENAKALQIPAAAAVGLSATPERDFDDGLVEYLVPRLGPILYRYNLADAIADGVLSGLSLVYVKIPLLNSEQEEYDRLSRRIAAAAQSADAERIESLLRARSRLYNNAFYRLPVARALLQQRQGRRGLVFLESIQAAEDLHRELEADGHSVCVYHSKMSEGMRRSNLRLFRRGAYDLLITCRALDEGFNVPEAELAVVVAGTASKRQRTQRVGRVLRTIAGKELGEVVTLYATPVEEKRLEQEAEDLGLVSQTKWQAAHVD